MCIITYRVTVGNHLPSWSREMACPIQYATCYFLLYMY